MRKLAMFKIDSLAQHGLDEEPFRIDQLPLEIGSGIKLEDVSALITRATFSWVKDNLSERELELLEQTRFALVYRYECDSLSGEEDQRAHKLIETVAACLRIVRPMRESVYLIRGRLEPNESFNVEHFTHPREILEIPEVQKLFSLRMKDIAALIEVLPNFLRVMNDPVGKLRMAVEFNQAAHFQDNYWKARFLLRCSALEALFTTNSWDHKGSLVAMERIKWLLGPDRCIYDIGDIPDYLPQAQITVRDTVRHVYSIRNHIAHGNQIPDSFGETLRMGVNGRLSIAAVADEALSFFVRKSLMKILRDSLEESFKDSDSSEAFFASKGLTKTLLIAAEKAQT